MKRYNGILVYSDSEDFDDVFFRFVCEGRILTRPALDVSSSCFEVETALGNYYKYNIQNIRPNIFIIHRGIFNSKVYESQRCFDKHKNVFYDLGQEMKFYFIDISPSLLSCLHINNPSQQSREAAKALDAILNREDSEKSYYKRKLKMMGVAKVDDMLTKNPIFSDFHTVLNLPLPVEN